MDLEPHILVLQNYRSTIKIMMMIIVTIIKMMNGKTTADNKTDRRSPKNKSIHEMHRTEISLPNICNNLTKKINKM